MLHIHLIVLGKLKENFWREAESEYLKRLQTMAKIFVHELREESFDEKDVADLIKVKEATKILAEVAKIGEGFLIAMDEHGSQFSSTDFSKYLSESTTKGNGNVIFIIGGPLGLNGSVLKKAQAKISLSKMTFTHQMCRVFLLEQIYRALMITGGRKYHY